jgi:uncharacterized protein YyaL (SSP411 family)
MTDEQGGFYCAEDADSEGVEGKFYLWTQDEIRDILTDRETDLFMSRYRHPDDIAVQGMQEIPAGHFLAHLPPSEDIQQDETGDLSVMESIREKLFAIREKRVHPHKDDKILTDWNGLMIAALARGAQVFDEPAYAKAALRAMDFIIQSMQTREGRLLHRYRDGHAAIEANIDDYSFIIWALLELYEATFQTQHLSKALEYQSRLFDCFRDDKDGGFFFTPDDAEELLTRPKELYDGAIPSGNSIAYINAIRLSRITGKPDIGERAHEIYRAFRTQADAMPTAFTQFLCGLDFAIGPSSEVIIAGNMNQTDTRAMLAALRRSFVPNKVVIFRPANKTVPDIETIAPFVQSHLPINGQATAYVCTNFTCALPTNDPQKMLELLNIKK